jgi:hypothetical protein
MENIMANGINWVKGFALLGMLAAMVGVFASAPAASASVVCSSDALGKISVKAVDVVKGNDVAGATVAVYNQAGEVVIKGTTDANGNFSTYSCTGTFKVRIFATNYKEYVEVVTVADNSTALVKAGLQPNSPRLSR